MEGATRLKDVSLATVYWDQTRQWGGECKVINHIVSPGYTVALLIDVSLMMFRATTTCKDSDLAASCCGDGW